MQQNIPIFSTVLISDTDASANSLVQRDNAGGATVTTLYAQVANVTLLQGGVAATQTTSFTAGAYRTYPCDTTAGPIPVTLPAASANKGIEYRFIKVDAAANAVTLTGALGTATTGTTQYKTLACVSNGTSWYSVLQT